MDVPAQYDGKKPASVTVFQDGQAYVQQDGDFRVPVVVNNLMHKGEMPVTIGIFINPGHLGEQSPKSPWEASNRSFEYDTLILYAEPWVYHGLTNTGTDQLIFVVVRFNSKGATIPPRPDNRPDEQ